MDISETSRVSRGSTGTAQDSEIESTQSVDSLTCSAGTALHPFIDWDPVSAKAALRHSLALDRDDALVRTVVTAIASGALPEDFIEVLEPYAECALLQLSPQAAHCWALPARLVSLVTRIERVGNDGKTRSVEAPSLVSSFGVMQFLSTAKHLSLHKSSENDTKSCTDDKVSRMIERAYSSPQASLTLDDVCCLNVDITPAEIAPNALATTCATAINAVRDTLAALPSIVAAYDTRVAIMISRLCAAIERHNNSIPTATTQNANGDGIIDMTLSSSAQPTQQQQAPTLTTVFAWALTVGAPLTVAACCRHGNLMRMACQAPAAFVLGPGVYKHVDPYVVPYVSAPRSGSAASGGTNDGTLSGRQAVALAVIALFTAFVPALTSSTEAFYELLIVSGGMSPKPWPPLSLLDALCVTANSEAVDALLAAHRRAPAEQLTTRVIICARTAYYALLTGAAASLSVTHRAQDVIATVRVLLAALRPCEIDCTICKGTRAYSSEAQTGGNAKDNTGARVLQLQRLLPSAYGQLGLGSRALILGHAAAGFFTVMADPQRHRAWLWALRQGVNACFVQWCDVAVSDPAETNELVPDRNEARCGVGERNSDQRDKLELELVFIKCATNWPACLRETCLFGGSAAAGLSIVALKRGLGALQAFVDANADDDQ